MDDGMEEGVGESSWQPSASPPGAAAAAGLVSGGGGGAHGLTDVWKEIHDRLVEHGNEEAISDPSSFRKLLGQHFERLPASYSIDFLHVDKAEDVLLHRRILAECADPDKRPIFHARFLNYCYAPIFHRREMEILRLHEIIFSSVDKPKNLSKLSALLSEVGLNIREAHVFSTTDGFCLDVFVVDGWDTEETDGLLQRLKETAARSHPSLSNPTNSSALERIQELQEKIGDSEFDRS